jgi:hypothetical protein
MKVSEKCKGKKEFLDTVLFILEIYYLAACSVLNSVADTSSKGYYLVT